MIKVSLDGKDYEISEKALIDTADTIIKYAMKQIESEVPYPLLVALNAFARKKLYDIERNLYEKGIEPEEAKKVRPKENQLHIERILELLIINGQELIRVNNVNLRFTKNNDGQIAHLDIERQN